MLKSLLELIFTYRTNDIIRNVTKHSINTFHSLPEEVTNFDRILNPNLGFVYILIFRWSKVFQSKQTLDVRS